MDYSEQSPPPQLAGLVKCRWTLAGDGAADTWLAQQATPDGCVELIWRLAGRSRWAGEQPARFAVGLIEEPTPFEISGDARFVALRIWPWAWSLLSAQTLAALRGQWQGFDHPLFDSLGGGDHAFPEDAARNARGLAILAADSVAAMGRDAGLSPRALQRWFAAEVGLPPRHYLRLLRFQKAFETVPMADNLADHAAAAGFADQAHMARTFRDLAGVPAGVAKRGAKGPFLA